ncbi:MAG: EpsI family protein [Candidatus Eisenbacteria bacterium]|nr:EpsI family protein [Candidatus Eisenbacteria bacterium]
MKTLLAAVVMLVATSASVLLTPPIDLAAGHGILRGVPHEFGPWQGTDAQFEQAVVEELRADDLLIRRYVDGTRSVWLCLVYHQNRRYGAHDPLLCYTSQGYAVRQPGRARVDDGSPKGLIVNTCIAERRDDSRVVWYWWTTDGLSTGDVGAFRSRMAVLGALDNRSWGTFVRVESVLREDGVEGATQRAREFSGLVARELPAVFARARAAAPAVP